MLQSAVPAADAPYFTLIFAARLGTDFRLPPRHLAFSGQDGAK
jgi:hypothetical protein